MKIVCRILILFVIFFYSLDFAQNKSGSAHNTAKRFLPGEEITYVVKYLMFEIGEVRLKILKRETINTDTVYSAAAYIDSYEGLPFVNLHQIYYTKFDSKQNPFIFKADIFDKDTIHIQYEFDKEQKKIFMTKQKEGRSKSFFDSVAVLDKNYQDGLSLFYFARARTGKNQKVTVPCLINEKSEITKINFYKEVEDISIDAVDYDIACVRLDGETEFRGIFGLTGYFEGWFSNDEFAIPILAKMQVIIGSITLELKEWKVEGWNPPIFE